MDAPGPGTSDRGTFERLIEEYADRIYNVALRITGNAADAEDVMQEAFENAYRAWPEFRGEAAPSTWLYRIAVNQALMRVRRRPIEFLTELPAGEDLRDWSAEISERGERLELRGLLETAIALLEPDLRAALVLRDIDGLSTSETADALEITESAVKSRLHRARRLVRQRLADYFQDR